MFRHLKHVDEPLHQYFDGATHDTFLSNFCSPFRGLGDYIPSTCFNFT
jgi:hypothetical protein